MPPALSAKSFQAGQSTVEMVLIMVVLLGIATMVASTFKDKELFAKLVESPWAQMAGMMQNGVWQTPDRGRVNHPRNRPITVRGEDVQ